KGLAKQGFELGAQEVHLQAWGDSAGELLRMGQILGGIDPRIVVKLPATQQGTTAAKTLIQDCIPVTITAVYTVHQAIIAAAIGAHYAAPYLGRINDSGKDGHQEVTLMQQALNGVRSETRVLTASIRNVTDISRLATQGVDTFTFSPAIAQALFNVPETIAATADFERAAKAMA
ncbi:MAG: transaldolase family protein, partial [Cyanobacteria bacterium J06635_11]